MLSVKFIKENQKELIERLAIKNFDAEAIVAEIIVTDNLRKQAQQELEEYFAESKKLAKEIGLLFKNKQIEAANVAKKRSIELKELSKKQNEKVSDLQVHLNGLLTQVPNIPHVSVPAGKSEADNVPVKSGGKMPTLPETAVPHWDLAKRFDIIDFELGNKITGAGFPVYKGKGAKLQRALISFFLDEAEKAGYNELMPPLLVNEASGFGTGQLPDKEGQMYHASVDNLYLIPTAEVPVTNVYRDVILQETDFPIKNVAYTACFRREAGSYGKDVRGLNRLHQFDKVEIVQIQHPDKSYETLDTMVAYVESLLVKLDLPYRIVKLCGGDTSFTSALTFDFEVLAAGQNKWLEVSSVSNFEAFQANRLKLRFKEKGEKKTRLAHTLNGSALALPRILAAILENNQTENGIEIPEVLRPYTRFDSISEKE